MILILVFRKFIVYSNTASTGLTIPYPAISLHAIQSLPEDDGHQGLYLQLISSAGGDAAGAEEDEDMESVSLTIIPSAPTDTTAESTVQGSTEEGSAAEPAAPPLTEATRLFNALSACSNLHPDPVAEGEGGEGIEGSSLFQAGLIAAGTSSGGLPPPMPGSGGWITAENMGEYFDADGNFIGGSREGDDEDEMEDVEGAADEAPLGPGAGTVRTREDEGADGQAGDGEELDETKWRRTD